MQNRQFIAAGLGSALAMIALAGLKVSVTPLSAAATPAFSASEPALQSVNRTLKSDRSSMLASTRDRSATSVSGDIVVVPELLDGCEPVISSIGNSLLARVAGSCLS